MIEARLALQRVDDGVLHDVLGIETRARIDRQTPATPFAKRRQRTLEQDPRRRTVAAPGKFEDVER